MLNLSQNLRSLRFAHRQVQAIPPVRDSSFAARRHTTKSLCEKCNAKPKRTRTDGTLSRFCSDCSKLRRHAKSETIELPTIAPQTNNLCVNCKQRPRFKENGKVHEYCSRSCADAAKASRLVDIPASKTNKGLREIRPLSNAGVLRRAFPSCALPPNGNIPGGYCATKHKHLTIPPPKLGKECILCKTRTALSNGFCGYQCITTAQGQAPCILPIPDNHDLFQNVQKQFTSSWRHPTPIPAVMCIYKIVNVKLVADKYDAYKQEVETRGQFVKRDLQPGNERRRWHGTTRACDIGNLGNTQLCTLPTCSLCSIIRNTFLIRHVQNKLSWKRFGTGIYSSSTSSKASGYSRNTTTSQYKAILLNRVVVGNGKKIEGASTDTSLTQPPAGYDSVLGEKGTSLNYDELVVYREDAIIPTYLVIYDA